MEVKVVILLFMVSVIGCKLKTNQFDKSLLAINSSKIDTLKQDTFIDFLFLSEEKYLIKWGTSDFTNISNDTFETLGNGNLETIESNDKYSILAQGCGTNCLLNVILPMSPNQKEMTFWQVVYSDIKNMIVIVTKDPSEGSFEIINFGYNIRKIVKLENLCPAFDKSSCIDSIFINGKELYFQYQGNKWKNDKPDNKIKRVRLE